MCGGSFFIWRKRRGLVARGRYGDGYIVIAVAPPVDRVSRSGRAKLVTSRTTIDNVTRTRIREMDAAGWSLRRIAADVGISHESVRSVLADTPVLA